MALARPPVCRCYSWCAFPLNRLVATLNCPLAFLLVQHFQRDGECQAVSISYDAAHIGNFRPSNHPLDSHCRYPMSPELVFETYHLIPELCASNTSFSKRLMALSYTLNFSPLSWTISPIPFKFDNWQVIRTAFELEGKKSLTIYSFELNCLRQKSLNTSYSLELNCLIRQKSLSTCPIFYSLELNC